VKNARHEKFFDNHIKFWTFDVWGETPKLHREIPEREEIYIVPLSKGSRCNNVGVPSAGLCPSRLLLSRNWKQCRETKHSARRCSLRCMHNVTWVTRRRAAAVQIMYRTWIKPRDVERYCIPQREATSTAKNYLPAIARLREKKKEITDMQLIKSLLLFDF